MRGIRDLPVSSRDETGVAACHINLDRLGLFRLFMNRIDRRVGIVLLQDRRVIIAERIADQIRALADRIREDPQKRLLRVPINSAAIGVNAPIEVFPMEEWRRLFGMNLFGYIAVTQTLLPALFQSKRRVVHISSVSGRISMTPAGAPSSRSKQSATPCGANSPSQRSWRRGRESYARDL